MGSDETSPPSGQLAWGHIHPEIRAECEPKARAEQFDDAVFAAFRLIEAQIQLRIGSASIGGQLVREAFSEPDAKILISRDTRTQSGIASLYTGALSIKGDRSHGLAPSFPCESQADCLRYLGLASLLLDLLDKDLNTFPQIETLRLFGTQGHPFLELRGKNFGQGSVVLGNSIELTQESAKPNSLVVLAVSHS